MFYGLGLREHVLSGGFAETFFFLYDNDSIQSKSRTCKQIITGSFRQVKNTYYSVEWSKKLFTISHYELQNDKCIVTQELGAYN